MPFEYERKGKVGYFTIRNGSVNPMTPAMHKELYGHMIEFLADDNVHVGIMQGAGDRAFSAGDDIKTEYAKFDTPRDELEYYMWPKFRTETKTPDTFTWSREVLALDRFKPIIAAVRGYCFGQGMIYLSQLTDIRVCSPDAKFGFPEINYGMGGAGGSTRLSRFIPHTIAMEMVLTGDPLDAEQALRANLVNAVVPTDQVLAKAEEYAARIARHPLIALRIEMEASMRGMDMRRMEALEYVKNLYRMQRMAYGGEERVERFLYKSDEPEA